MAEIDVVLIPIVIDKCALKKHGPDPTHVYHLAMQLGLEKLYQLLRGRNQHGGLTHVIFEARGKCEDIALELEFRKSERPRGSPRGSDAGRVVPTHLCFHHTK